MNNLWSAFILMDSKDDIRLLFKDLFTHTEYKMFAKRLEVARRLIKGQTYEIIAKELNVTPGTIAHLNNILEEKGGGLKKAHQKLEHLEKRYLSNQREYQKDLENHFRKKTKRRTLLGESLKVGIKVLDTALSKKFKHKTANKSLIV